MFDNSIDLDIEESNELLFKIKIEGTDPSPAKVRLVCESSAGEISYMFSGQADQDDNISFNIPPMINKLKEGNYTGKIEVLVENRYFSPMQFEINFKKTMKVVAESLQVVKKTAPVQSVTVTSSPIIVVKQRDTSTTLPKVQVENKKQLPVIDKKDIHSIARQITRNLTK